MSYRSLKRVLGETSLERKCRLLFGLCLLVLISGTFYWVERIAENLVKETALRKGRDSVDLILLKIHWEGWEADKQFQPLLRELSHDLLTQPYDHKLLRLDDNTTYMDQRPGSVKLAENADEAKILRELKAKLDQQRAGRIHELGDALDGGRVGEAPTSPPTSPLAMPREIMPVYRMLWAPSHKSYYYYQPVYWKNTCSRCHIPFAGQDALSAAAGAGELPFRAVKVIIPDAPTQQAITWNRAILITTAIVTVFVAMIALYIIVRYVIVKPLTHLRDVSDAISRGKTELRAEIHTGDEFEELAASFNRMLRHLTDTQMELRQVNEDLDMRVDQLAQLNMQLYEMNRLKGDFLANMSHELRTPLNSIIGFSEVLQGLDSLSDKQKRYAQNIQKSGRLLLEMINDILDLAKMEAGKMEVRPTECRIDTLVNAQCDMVRSLAEDKNIDLEVNVTSDSPPLYQDQGKVQQILTNLLSNAIKFTPEGGRIVVSAQRDSHDRLELTVADTGVGIAEEDREVVFEKFRQSRTVFGEDRLTREYSGTGLGLSIVKELCKLLGGEIAFESELGKGSTFKVVVPWTRPDRSERDADLAAKLDGLSRPARGDFQRGREVRQPALQAAASPSAASSSRIEAPETE